MKNIFKMFGITTIAAVIAFSMTACYGQSGGKTLNSPEALKEYLDKQPANTPDKPIKVTISANELMLPRITRVLNSTGKYVSLNLSGSALTKIPEYAFFDDDAIGGKDEGCKTLVSINIPNSVISIESDAFRDCTSLTSVTIPNSVTSLSGFDRCTNLKNITIPKSVTSIGGFAFGHCTNLTSVTFEAGSDITDANFGNNAFPEKMYGYGNTLKAAYSTGKAGTYTRDADGSTWTKQ